MQDLYRWSGRQWRRPVLVPHPTGHRRSRPSAARRRAPAAVRAADIVLAVALVAILGVVCLMLAGSLIGTADDLAPAPISAQPS
ncbi:hypothetical protein ACQVP2_20185 [Methylobacterium aquaticum]|uniref:hypothetical protein n=1 Tax=Methylobacterium aquaticum TaxID=270351 RepID=UPI003D16F99A